jgi:3'-5' exoribonuclease
MNEKPPKAPPTATPAVPPTVVVRLSDLKPGEAGTFYAQLFEKTKRVTHANKPFYTCLFRDKRRSATYKVWTDSRDFDACERHWTPGQFFRLNAVYTEHDKYGGQIDVARIRLVEVRDFDDGFNEADILNRSRFDSAAMFKDLREFVGHNISDDPLKRLVTGLLDAHAAKILIAPASFKQYFPFPGGWLEHTINVARHCLFLVESYRLRYPDLTPPLNQDLVLAGAVLHEFGRLIEFELPATDLEPVTYSVDGMLFGRHLLCRDLVRDAAKAQGDLHPEMLRLLEHLLMSYLAIPEWGSPRLPMIPEVLILHHVDDLDAKLEMYARCLTNDPSPGPFTERDPVLHKQLLKTREL